MIGNLNYEIRRRDFIFVNQIINWCVENETPSGATLISHWLFFSLCVERGAPGFDLPH